ncbi:MAG: ComF family protein [Defluviitaleaceae bacterium]|nr:ComF family protein [Defluviitaleaceae bacterium]
MIIDTFLKYIFPPRCMSCGDILPIDSSDGACVDCIELFERYKNDNRGEDFALYIYSEAVRQAIHNFKYGLRPGYGVWLGALMADHAEGILPGGLHIDAVIPIPLYTDKQRERGFNQAEILAAELCRRLGHLLERSALVRVRPTERQAFLSAAQRRENVWHAFAVAQPSAVEGKTILLMDDIYTTGSTIQACRNALKAAGASRVISYVLANAPPPVAATEAAYEKISKCANINDNLFR